MSSHFDESLSQLPGLMKDAMDSIPTPIKKNFFTAVSRLGAAFVDIPVAWAEGRAATIRAVTDARVKLTREVGQGTGDQVAVPREYAARAVEIYGAKILREQVALDRIVEVAREEVAADPVAGDNTTVADISEEWLGEFEQRARNKSSEDMRLIFGKILAGEIRKPGTFSIRTLHIISLLDAEAAKAFQRLCSLSVAIRGAAVILDLRVLSLNGDSADVGALDRYGITRLDLNLLNEYGLISNNYNTWVSYYACVVQGEQSVVPLYYNRQSYVLEEGSRAGSRDRLALNGVGFSNAGYELYTITPQAENREYTRNLELYFHSMGLKLRAITINGQESSAGS